MRGAPGSLGVQRKDGAQRAKVRGERKESRLLGTARSLIEAVALSHRY